jgi:hypothetical protein
LDRTNASIQNTPVANRDNPSSGEDYIFYPLELSKSPEYQAYTLIQLFQPETTDLASTTQEERLASAQAKVLSEAGKYLSIAGAAKATQLLGGGVGLGIIASLGVGVAQFLGETAKNENLSPEEKESIVASVRREINEQRLSRTRMEIQAKPSFGKIKYSIGLPMPKSIKTNYGFEYEDVDFKNVAQLRAIANMIRSVKEAGKDEVAKNAAKKEGLDALGNLARSARLGALDEALKLIPGGASNFEAYEDTRAGRVKSPMSESLFKNVSRRTFDFSWEMIPKSRNELESIYKIILLLKTNSHPKQINSDPYYLGIPGEFLVKFYIANKENEFLPKIARLCMKSIDVDYGDDSGMSFFRIENIPPGGNFPDGRLGAAPTKITLSIKMEELEFLTADRIVEGY